MSDMSRVYTAAQDCVSPVGPRANVRQNLTAPEFKFVRPGEFPDVSAIAYTFKLVTSDRLLSIHSLGFGRRAPPYPIQTLEIDTTAGYLLAVVPTGEYGSQYLDPTMFYLVWFDDCVEARRYLAQLQERIINDIPGDVTKEQVTLDCYVFDLETRLIVELFQWNGLSQRSE